MQKINPYLWFDGQAEQAAEHYVDVFRGRPGDPKGDTRITNVSRTGEDGGVMIVEFELDGLAFVALNGGPQFTFNESVSFLVHCETQEEVDHFWTAFTAEGEESMCGWLKDRYGLSWQIVPDRLMELLGDPDPGRAQRAMQAMLRMRKIDIGELEAAADAA
ncbi:MAG TPA: VOC family protein [Actinomycetota bacterium]|jgi:predicted 3-demethylubiquinone-9 3-methyltransferase (glyoxalase superfamily)|nr:VOC family protein [Actinomycetota bacterium]